MEVALGLVPHTGWAHAVVVAGDAKVPQVLHRARVELVTDGVERFAYHLVQDWPLEKAAASVAATEAAAAGAAAEALGSLADVAMGHGSLVGVAVVGRPHDVPDALEAVLAKHHLLHAAEGELYLSAIMDAAGSRDLPVSLFPPKDTVGDAAAALGTAPGLLAGRLADLRSELGAPWQADHKAATAAALAVLHGA